MLRFLRRLSLTQWILIAMVIGSLVGWAFPDEQWTGKVKSVSADKSELVVTTPEDSEITLRRSDKPVAGAWEGTDPAREVRVKVTVLNATDPNPGSEGAVTLCGSSMRRSAPGT